MMRRIILLVLLFLSFYGLSCGQKPQPKLGVQTDSLQRKTDCLKVMAQEKQSQDTITGPMKLWWQAKRSMLGKNMKQPKIQPLHLQKPDVFREKMRHLGLADMLRNHVK